MLTVVLTTCVLLVSAGLWTYLLLRRYVGADVALGLAVLAVLLKVSATYFRYNLSIVDARTNDTFTDTLYYLERGEALVTSGAGAWQQGLREGTPFMIDLAASTFALLGPNYWVVYLAGSLLGFVGTVLIGLIGYQAGATRRAWWFIAIVAFPSTLYWTSSFGKESVTLFGVGVVIYCMTRIWTHVSAPNLVRVHYFLLVAFAIFLAGMTRAQIGVLLIAAIVGAQAFVAPAGTRAWEIRGARILVGTVLTTAALIWASTALFGGQLDIIDDLSSRYENTSLGSSQIATQRPGGLAGIAIGTFTAIFRPLPWEGGLGGLVSALDTPIILGVAVCILAVGHRVRRMSIENVRALILASIGIVGLFAALVSYANLGILVRMRSQIMPLTIVLLAALWHGRTTPRYSPVEAAGLPEGPQRTDREFRAVSS